MAASLCIYALSFFGVQGFDAMWQSFTDITSPYLWTFGQAVIIELATSLVGTVFFGFAVMLCSELTKSMFVSVIVGAVVLLLPILVSFKANFSPLLPTSIMRGVPIWSAYYPAKLFGCVIPMTYISLAAACILSALFGLAVVGIFSKRQAA